MRLLPLLFLLTLPAGAQQLESLAPNLSRLSGVDEASHTAYTRLFVSSGDTLDLARPTLTAECTQDASGKPKFALLVNFGGITDTSYHAPWRPTSPSDKQPPRQFTKLTLDFLGYRKVKPVTREFEVLSDPFHQLRYNNSGLSSSNMEDAAYWLLYLRALPTLSVTRKPDTATFLTTALLAQLKKEPNCSAARF